MKQFNSNNVYYLEDTEFDKTYKLNSKLINKTTGEPFFSGITIVMVQGMYCGYCSEFKPSFQKIADEMTTYGIDFATIQIDGSEKGELIFKGEELTSILGQPLEGVPVVIKFYKGRPVDKYMGSRDYNGLKEWILK